MGSGESKPASSNTLKSIKPYGVSSDTTTIRLTSSYLALYDGIVSLIEENKYSDLLVICGSDRYPVHRAIVCPRSTWFKDKCESALQQVDYSSPASPMKIWLDPGEESHVIAAVLTFLYTLDYADSGPQLSFGLPQDQTSLFSHNSDDPAHDAEVAHSDDEATNSIIHQSDETVPHPASSRDNSPLLTPATTTASHDSASTRRAYESDPSSHPNELVFHVQMLLAGQRFGIPPLCEVAKVKFEKRLRCESWKTELLPCIREAYRQQGNASTNGLKDTVVKTAKSRFRFLKEAEGWDALVMDFPEFAADMLRHL
ncbi:hypothetical protein K432DRAFT_343511 [Lepidopterella palustris CBS 459.81]|uniref:BTB domain-containing protein n=1 Tax=Lepidopterella palustris CBS 459.81 TaxID=1314670 RepID=A0A8E2EJW1_9PEZI|nr:hypothetical protein K432DRAFT_343511 [Lepidopterella palustris CBS 459.81]